MVDPTHITAMLLAPATRAYERRLRQFGPTARGVFWRDDAWQRRRYDILAQAFRPDDRQGGTTICDFGCGYGALFDYLAARPVMDGSLYLGIDMSEDMIAACQARIRDERATFERHVALTKRCDYVLVSGTFNLKMAAADEVWLPYVLNAIEQLWSGTKKVLAFNMLDADGDDERQQGLYYADGPTFETFCNDHLKDARVTLRYDPPLPDWTIFVERVQPTP